MRLEGITPEPWAIVFIIPRFPCFFFGGGAWSDGSNGSKDGLKGMQAQFLLKALSGKVINQISMFTILITNYFQLWAFY